MCVQKKESAFFITYNRNKFSKLVNFKLAKFSNPFEAISLTNTQKDKDNMSSKIEFSNTFPKFGYLSKRCIILYLSAKYVRA